MGIPAKLSDYWLNLVRKNRIKLLCDWDYKKTKTSDTVFLLGSGPSAKTISPTGFARIKQHDSIGFNFWAAHEFVPSIYGWEGADIAGVLYADLEQKEEAYANIPIICFDCMIQGAADVDKVPEDLVRNMFVAETHFVDGDNRTMESYRASFSSMLAKGFFYPRDRIKTLCRRKSSGIFYLSLAVLMGYKNIILVGYDYNNGDYFHDHESLKKPSEHYPTEDPAQGIPVSSVFEAMYQAVIKPMGINLKVASQTSKLARFLPVCDTELAS